MLRDPIYAMMLVLGFGLGIGQARSVAIKPIREFSAEQGGILSGSFSAPNQIVVETQDIASSTPPNGRPVSPGRHLAIYDLREAAWIHSIPIESEGEANGCSKIIFVKISNSLVVCEGDRTVRIRDAGTLKVKQVVALTGGVRLDDLAVSERQDVVYTVGVNQSGTLIIGSYSLTSGTPLKETEASEGFRYPSVSLAIADGGQHLAIAVEDPGNRKMRGAIIICNTNDQPMTCRSVPQKEFVAQAAFLYDSSLLFVSSVLATAHSSECVQSLQLATFKVETQTFCSKDGPAHYTLAVLGRDRVIAFTGYVKRNGFTENTTAVKNDASVWSVEPRRIVALAGDGANSGALQNEMRIVADHQGDNRFMIFRRFAGTVSVYELPSAQ